MKIEARGHDFKELNELIHAAVNAGNKMITLENVNGQRYIGCGLAGDVKIQVNGVPGNDMAAFMDGPQITVRNNAQDVIGNTMNSGEVIVHGAAGDVLGYGMRGGRLFIKGDVGYRVGIHMKSYKEDLPVIIVGGTSGDFLGEYMAGGILIVLGLDAKGTPLAGDFVGTGMHGGTIYLRGKVEDHQLGKEVKVHKATDNDLKQIKSYLSDFCKRFGYDIKDVMSKKFVKLIPFSHRPYGRIYSY